MKEKHGKTYYDTHKIAQKGITGDGIRYDEYCRTPFGTVYITKTPLFWMKSCENSEFLRENT